MTQTITVQIELQLEGYDGTQVIPTFWTEAATISAPDGEPIPFDTIGVSMVNPMVFYLMTDDDEAKGPNGGFLASVNVMPAIKQIARNYAGYVEVAENEARMAREDAAGDTGEPVEDLEVVP